jgi:hypothetical protein
MSAFRGEAVRELMIDGKGFAAGIVRQNQAAVVDPAPTRQKRPSHRAKIGEALEQLLSPFCGP